jgi:starvation-inducible outer membrane lipoprotein
MVEQPSALTGSLIWFYHTETKFDARITSYVMENDSQFSEKEADGAHIWPLQTNMEIWDSWNIILVPSTSTWFRFGGQIMNVLGKKPG